MSEAGENNIDEYEDDFEEEDLDIDENGVEELDDIQQGRKQTFQLAQENQFDPSSAYFKTLSTYFS